VCHRLTRSNPKIGLCPDWPRSTQSQGIDCLHKISNGLSAMKTIVAAAIPTTISSCIRLTLLVSIAFNAPDCFSEWTQTIQCQADHTHRDVREYAGREEFCEMVEPGSLAFKDGPYRSWYSEGHPGASGQYVMGRQVGHWRECDRFDRCQQHEYPAVYAGEQQRRGFKQ
jgi:hypothetical protein